MSHLTLDERIKIQEGLDNGDSLRTIAKNVGKSPSTVMREVGNHKYLKGKRSPDLKPDCALKKTCTIEHLCMDVKCSTPCRNCISCRDNCPKFVPATCEKLGRSPYVCNGCLRYNSCGFGRTVYLATYADNEYRNTLAGCREGLNIEPDELQRIDGLVSPLIRKGQSVAHIYASHRDEIGLSRSTVYKYIDIQALSARNIDLRRKVKYKVRRKTADGARLTRETKLAILSRNYVRFQEYIQKNPDTSIVEMDTVVGRMGSKKVLLTLLFRSCNLMVAILLPEKTQEAVIAALNDICDGIGIECFRKLFGVILTDRGTEFYNPEAMECDSNGEIKTRVFYCDPQCSWQKGALERNHEFIRYVLPKKTSFDSLTQEDVTLMVNHVNSVARDKFNGASPYRLSRLLIDNKFHEYLGLKEIAADDIMLRPSLLGLKNAAPDTDDTDHGPDGK